MINIKNEFSNKDILMHYTDIGKQISKSKLIINERKTNLFSYIFTFAASVVLFTFFVLNSSISSKIQSLELQYKEVEVNYQRDQRELQVIENKLKNVDKESKEVTQRHSSTIEKFNEVNERYERIKKEHSNSLEELNKLNLREKEIKTEIDVVQYENHKQKEARNYISGGGYNNHMDF